MRCCVGFMPTDLRRRTTSSLLHNVGVVEFMTSEV
jgi:hypothetical protein